VASLAASNAATAERMATINAIRSEIGISCALDGDLETLLMCLIVYRFSFSSLRLSSRFNAVLCTVSSDDDLRKAPCTVSSDDDLRKAPWHRPLSTG